MSMRYKLFALRDRLRMLKIEHGEDIKRDVYQIVEENINTAINVLPFYTGSYIIKAGKIFDENEKLKRSVENRVKKVDSCNILEIREISAKATDYTLQTLLFNSGGWIPYMVPIFILMISYGWIRRMTKELVFVKNEQNLGINSYSPELVSI